MMGFNGVGGVRDLQGHLVRTFSAANTSRVDSAVARQRVRPAHVAATVRVPGRPPSPLRRLRFDLVSHGFACL